MVFATQSCFMFLFPIIEFSFLIPNPILSLVYPFCRICPVVLFGHISAFSAAVSTAITVVVTMCVLNYVLILLLLRKKIYNNLEFLSS